MHIKNRGKKLLSELLAENNINLDMPCGGGGVCGKCKIKAKGALSSFSDAERRLLSDAEKQNGVRLACKTFVFGDVEIDHDYDGKFEVMQSRAFNVINEEKCIAAIDLGTTFIEAKFYSQDGKTLLKHGKIKNPQTKYGADIVSRIMFSKESDGREKLRKELFSAISELAGDFYDKIERCVIVGNTSMLHFYSGLDTSKIATYPFEPETLFGYWEKNVFLPRCISSYVGADTVAAILASDMLIRKAPSLLVDIGTNGEMALFDGEKLFVASTAAGPALEGASISYGMIAKSGAIKHIFNDGSYETVGDSAPKGICASGLIDAVSYMLKTKKISKDGYLSDEFEINKSGVFLLPKDIRNFQLAKAAIKAGIETLLNITGISVNELNKLYITGALGSNADVENCMEVGLIPKIDKNKIILLENAALCGASMILKDEKNIKISDEIARKAKHIELSLSDEFSKKYIDSLSF